LSEEVKLLIGTTALLLLLVLDPERFPEWLLGTFAGIAVSSLFLSPLSELISGRRISILLVSVGVAVFLLYAHFFLGDDPKRAAEFLLSWLATFSFISLVFRRFFVKVERVFE